MPVFRLTPYVLRNLATAKATRRYPRERRSPFEAARGELVNQIEACIFCGTCEAKCPSGCISVDKKAGTWTYDPFSCVFCAVCVDACPAECLRQKTAYLQPRLEKTVVHLKGTPPVRKRKTGPEADARTEPVSGDL
jgi:ech hydrogenase subunit F